MQCLDITSAFLVRRNALAQLHSALANNTDFIAITGTSGIGKTTFVKHAFLNDSKSCYGKFDFARQATPLATLLASFATFLDNLKTNLHSNYENHAYLKHSLSDLTKKIISPYFPFLIDNKHLDVQIDTYRSEQVIYAFLHLLEACCYQNHLQWVVDDLQWADDFSLIFLNELSGHKALSGKLSLILIYRSEEIKNNIKAYDYLNHVMLAGVTITLTPFKGDQVKILTKQLAQQCGVDDAKRIQLACKYGQGNPIRILSVLNFSQVSTHDQDFLSSYGCAIGQYIKQTKGCNLQDLLCVACFGQAVDWLTLSLAWDCSIDQAKHRLNPIVKKGLLVSNDRHVAFSHDSVQLAIINTMSQKTHIRLNWQMAKQLLSAHKKVPLTMEQLSMSVRMLETVASKSDSVIFEVSWLPYVISCADYLLKQCVFTQAEIYYALAKQFDTHQHYHAITLQGLATTQLCQKKYDDALEHLLQLQKHHQETSAPIEQMVEVFLLLMKLEATQNHYNSVIQHGNQALDMLGVDFKTDINNNLKKYKSQLDDYEKKGQHRSIFTKIISANTRFIRQILRAMSLSMTFVDISYMQLLGYYYLCSCITDGVEPEDGYGLIYFILHNSHGVHKETTLAYYLAKSEELVKKSTNMDNIIATGFLITGIKVLYLPLSECAKLFQMEMRLALGYGDYECYAYLLLLGKNGSISYFTQEPMCQIIKQFNEISEKVHQHQPLISDAANCIVYNASVWLKKTNRNMNQENLYHANDNALQFSYFHITRVELDLHQNLPNQAQHHLNLMQPYTKFRAVIVKFYPIFFQALLNYWPGKSTGNPSAEPTECEQRLQRWAKQCPENFQHQWQLVQGLKYLSEDNFSKGITLLSAATCLAEQRKYYRDAALGYQLQAYFQPSNAPALLWLAQRCYQQIDIIIDIDALYQRWKIQQQSSNQDIALSNHPYDFSAQSMLQQLSIPAIIVTAADIITWVNHAATNWFGWQVGPTPFTEQLSRQQSLNIREITQQMSVHNPMSSIETQLLRQGKEIAAMISVSSIWDSKQQLHCYTLVVQDMTKGHLLKKTNIFRQRQVAKMTQQRILEINSSSIAHQLTQPLTVIISQIDALYMRQRLKYYMIEPIVDDVLSKIKTHALTMGEVIHRLKNQHIADDNTQSQQPILLDDWLLSICEIYAFDYVVFDQILEPILKCNMIKLDSVYLEQVLVILINNSIEATAKNTTWSTQLHVNLNVSMCDGMLEVIMSDNGPGVPSVIRDCIFEQYYSTKDHGSGIGLSLAKSMLQSIDGDIILLDKSPGAHFKLQIPASFKTGLHSEPINVSQISTA